MLLFATASQAYDERPRQREMLPKLRSMLASVYSQAIDVQTPGVLMPLNMSVSHLVEDHGMAEVFRESSACFQELEGLGGGGAPIGDCGKPYLLAGGFTKEEADCNRKVGYGCWFWHAKGTGVFVNVGRSLRVSSRCDAHKALGLYRHNATAEIVDAYCDNPPGDRLYCERARARGYDSIQIAMSHGIKTPELIMCSGKCMTETVQGSCAPLDMKQADGDHCQCVEGRGAINCGQDEGGLSQHLLKLVAANMIDEWGCNHMQLGMDYDNPLRRQAQCEPGAVDNDEREDHGTVVIPQWHGLPMQRSLLAKFWHDACSNGLYPPGTCRRVCVSQDAAPVDFYD